MVATETILIASRATGLYRATRRDEWVVEHLAEAPLLAALEWHPTLPIVYGVGGSDVGELYAWRVDDSGATLLHRGTSGGEESCALTVAPDGSWLVIANYTSSAIARVELGSDGIPTSDPVSTVLAGRGPDDERQEAAHPHQVHIVDGDVIVVDLGIDAVVALRDGVVVATDTVPAGAGPRHAVLRDGEVVALSGELDETVLFKRDGAWHARPSTDRTSPAKTRSERNYPGDLKEHEPSGTIIVANRGLDTVRFFAPTGDEAEAESGAAWPQHLAVVGNTLFMTCEDDNVVTSMQLHPETGLPAAPAVREFTMPKPSWLLPARV